MYGQCTGKGGISRRQSPFLEHDGCGLRQNRRLVAQPTPSLRKHWCVLSLITYQDDQDGDILAGSMQHVSLHSKTN